MSVLTAGVTGLEDVHTAVTTGPEAYDVTISFLSPSGSLYLFGALDDARGLLTDALAQLDAITAQHTEDEP